MGNIAILTHLDTPVAQPLATEWGNTMAEDPKIIAIDSAAFADRTIGESIDARIGLLNAEIIRLQGVRDQLSTASGVLSMRLDELRSAIKF